MATSEVAGDVVATSSTFKWTINNFSASCKNVGDRLKSPTFTTNISDSNNIQWYMRMYPKGVKEEYKDYLSLFLNANVEIQAVCTFIISDNEGNKIVSHTLNEHVFGKPADTGWGRSKYISRDLIENPANRVLNDDKLTIVCEITNIKSINQKMKVQEDDVLQHRLQDEYEALINDSKFSDVALISEGKTVKAHKCILAQRSLVFAAMFEADMKEKQASTVEITDVKYDVLVEMIRFIYAEKVNNIDVLVGELAVAADKYALEGLKNRCERTMLKNLSIGNVIYYLQLADRLFMDELKKKTIEFMVQNAGDVSVRPDFDLLSRDIVREVFQCFSNKNK